MTTEITTPIAQALSPMQPIFDAIVKAVADRIMKQVLESQELETKISMTMDLLLEDKLDVDGEIEHWMRNNFDIGDYEHDIQMMTEVDEAVIKDIIRGFDFTISVD
jgi:isopentenyl phosphate kinase